MGSLFSRKKAEPAKPQASSTEDPASSQSETQAKDTAAPPLSGPPVTNDIAFIDEDGDEDSPTEPKVTQEPSESPGDAPKVEQPHDARVEQPHDTQNVEQPQDKQNVEQPQDKQNVEQPQDTQKVEQQDDRKDKTIHTVTFKLPEKKEDSTAPVQLQDIKFEVPVQSENVIQVPKASGDSDIEISTELPVESESSQTTAILEGLKVTVSHSPPKPHDELENINQYHNDIETCLEHSGEEKTHTKVETLITLERPPSVVNAEPDKEVIENALQNFATKVEVVLQPSPPTQEIHNVVEKNEEELIAQLATQLSEQTISEGVSQEKSKIKAKVTDKQNASSKTLITFTWEQEGSEVFLSGSFNNWDELIAMELSDNKHLANVELANGTHYYKFFVDGNWTVNTKLPVVEIVEKGQVNQIEVNTQG